MNSKKGSSGFSLIEVLIALVIISVGLIGLAALQARGLQYNQGAYLRSQANVLAYDMIDRMRINRADAQAGAYNLSLSASAPSGSTLAAQDLVDWLGLLAGSLPAGDGEVSCDVTLCSVRVTWQEADGATYEFNYQTQTERMSRKKRHNRYSRRKTKSSTQERKKNRPKKMKRKK